MQKNIFRFLTASCLSFISINAMALTCSDNPEQNKVEANNYIFKILDFIDSTAKGIKQEVRTSTITSDTRSTTQFKIDTQGRVIASEQIKQAPDFTFIENDSYQFDNNNCLINKNVQWQLKELDANGQVVGTVQKGASIYAFG